MYNCIPFWFWLATFFSVLICGFVLGWVFAKSSNMEGVKNED